MAKEYIVISINEDGDIYVQSMSRETLEQAMLRGEIEPCTASDIDLLRSGKLVDLMGIGSFDIIIKGTFPGLRTRVIVDGIE